MSSLEHTFETLLSDYGIAALFVTITLETLGAPLPGESALILASGAAAAGELPIRGVVLAAFAAAILGDNLAYLIGRRLGRDAVLRLGHHVGLTPGAMAKAEAVTARYGPLMVVGARFVVILRQLNGLVAGTTGMPWPRFLAANVAGAALWVGVWTLLPYRFGHEADIVPLIWHHLSLVAALVVPLVLIGLVALRIRRRRRG
jgi:membrane protein DedA with SNARE-associated domain